MSIRAESSTERSEAIFDYPALDRTAVAPGVSMRLFASAACGARNFCTAAADIEPHGSVGYHVHSCHESVVLLAGSARLLCEGRAYDLEALDCVFIPGGVAHALENRGETSLRLHGSYSSASPDRAFVADGPFEPVEAPSERVVRFSRDEAYELAPNTAFHDLFCGRLGASDICGGYGSFEPGAGLPCHVHDYDESITIIEGEALCQVDGRQYELANWGTAVIPAGFAHRFVNRSDKPMKMIWVYAGTNPERRLVDTRRCSDLA